MSGDSKTVVLVTGGSGLVGQAIKHFVENGGRRDGETWHFATSKDADLASMADTKALFERIKVRWRAERHRWPVSTRTRVRTRGSRRT